MFKAPYIEEAVPSQPSNILGPTLNKEPQAFLREPRQDLGILELCHASNTKKTYRTF